MDRSVSRAPSNSKLPPLKRDRDPPQPPSHSTDAHQPQCCRWDALPQVGSGSYRSATSIIRKIIEKKMEVARQSEAEREAFANYCEEIEEARANERVAPCSLRERAQRDVHNRTRQVFFSRTKELARAHDEHVERVREVKQQQELDFYNHVSAIERNDTVHQRSLDAARQRQWLLLLALVRLPVALGLHHDLARPRRLTHSFVRRQREALLLRTTSLGDYISLNTANAFGAFTLSCEGQLTLLYCVSQFIRILARFRRFHAATLIRRFLLLHAAVNTIPRTVSVFYYRLRRAQRMCRTFAQCSLERFRLLERQWAVAEKQCMDLARECAVAALQTLEIKAAAQEAALASQTPYRKPSLTLSGLALQNGQADSPSKSPLQRRLSEGSHNTPELLLDPPTNPMNSSLTCIPPQALAQRGSLRGSLRASISPRVNSLSPVSSPLKEEVLHLKAKIAEVFSANSPSLIDKATRSQLLRRHLKLLQRQRMKAWPKYVVERRLYEEERRKLQDEILLKAAAAKKSKQPGSPKATNNQTLSSLNPALQLELLKPPIIPYCPCLANGRALTGQIRTLLNERLAVVIPCATARLSTEEQTGLRRYKSQYSQFCKKKKKEKGADEPSNESTAEDQELAALLFAMHS